MASFVVFWALFAEVILQTCLGASVAKLTADDLVTVDTHWLNTSESQDPDPADISEETDEWDDWDDYEEDTINNCNLTSFEENSRAFYLCEDGTAWSVDIEKTDGENCIYSRNVITPRGEYEVKKTDVNCIVAQEWFQDLVQYEVLSGIPDMFLFNLTNSENHNSKILPTVYEPFQT